MAKSTNKIPPAYSHEAREARMISLAEDLAEQQLMDGTASAQVITHYLKLATIKTKYELEKLQAETELAKAKIDSMESSKRSEELMEEAIRAFKSYQGEDYYE